MMPTDDQFKIIAAITLKLAQLGHEVSFVEPITTGPIVTTYRFVPKSATKIAQIASCAEDIALTLKVEDVLIRRLVGEAVVGISVPNASRTKVLWRDTLRPPDPKFILPLNLGVDSQGRLFRDDLTTCPHLLIAGSTNGGKSVLLHGIIGSLMYWKTPNEVQFALSDTKKVEFTHFEGSPHLVCKTAETMYETWQTMDWLINEIELRLLIISRAGKRNISEYNLWANDAYQMYRLTEKSKSMSLPYIVLVIDELADVLGGDKRGEAKIANSKIGKIVQKSRATGIHVIAATQRPSVDIVTGSIKSNFPARLSFKLPSETDSRTVLSQSGAEHLLSQGDMLYSSTSVSGLKRLHAAYASIEDIRQCVNVARMQYEQI